MMNLVEIDERSQNINSLTFEEHTSIQYEEPTSREPKFETEESKFKSDETESESDETETESDKTEFESDKTNNESNESKESEETETIPKFPNNTYSDLMTLIIQHNLNNKARNAIIRFFNKHSNLLTSPLPKNIEQGRKLMNKMKLINLLNKEKVILKYNNKDYIIYYRPIINYKTNNESNESKESEETETIPKFPNNTYSDLMTLIIQHNLNNKARNAIIRFFNKHSNLLTSPLPKNIEQGRKLMNKMKLINLLNKEKSNNNRNYNEQYTANW
ncbi:hypothetical protein Glove_173g71 [Diversispora epigaea]|uniref:Uncharacterized protein n=1 Tax=Diversispora epigaea TaxID=1348612 RepID=A0A397IP02_9GLOM|nr:hypothetical protein Glove_173g71 [Diversispora epigaea]